jgi:uncharacterized membrane protein YccC
MTAAIVLKPDFQTTFFRGFARIGGTLLGAIIAPLILIALRNNGALEIAGILIATAIAYLTFFPNYALFTVAITSFVVLVLHMRGLPGTTAIYARLLDTLGGGALAMIGYLALPSWEGKRTRALLADLVEAQRDVATTILEAYVKGSPESKAAITRARNAAWQARTAVEASIDRSRQEPNRPHTIGPGRALRILAATQRFGLANLALETAIDAPLDEAFRSSMGEFSKALGERMDRLAAALRGALRLKETDRLPTALAVVEAMVTPESAPVNRFVAERLRAYVDATTAITRLVGATS